MSGDSALRQGRDETGTDRTGQAAPGRPSAPEVPAAIQVSHLTKVFGGRTAVSDVSFSVAGGEVFGFLGPNGAGKTTTVRILGTLISPTSGSATVAGIPVGPAGAAEIRQRISVMPESPGLYQRLTVTENLEYFVRLYGLPRREARISEALAAVGLSDRAHDLAGSLSKGLRQRAALARSLLNEPAVMFLDEPTSGLDPVAAHEVLGLIDALRPPCTACASNSAPTSRIALNKCANRLPLTVTDPAVGRSSPKIIRIVVVLPAPFGPRKPVTRPGRTVNDRRSTAALSP